MNLEDLRKKNEKLQLDVEGFVKPFHEMNPQTNDMVAPVFAIQQVFYSYCCQSLSPFDKFNGPYNFQDQYIHSIRK